MSKNLGKLFAGVGIGVGIGMLFAPDKGEKTRKKLKYKLNELCNNLKNIDADDIKEKVMNQINDIKLELDDLDKEKVLKIAKDKGKVIVDKCEELYKISVKKGSKELEQATDSIRKVAIDVLNNTVDKLEKGNKKN